MTRQKSFGLDVIADQDSRVLILGSLPGAKSLECRKYYAHPRNQFWPIMEHLLEVRLDLQYEGRIARLQQAGIAIWDVCRSAYRSDSLDSKLVAAEPNDFSSFLEKHPAIEIICFAGAKAEKLYQHEVQPRLNLNSRKIQYMRLPSPSSAYATLPYEQKLSQWISALRPFLTP